MSLRNLILFRGLSTANILRRPTLSQEYKSKELWDERLRCKFLSDDVTIIKTINSKIISGESLSNLETDVFINIANPNEIDTAQLQEALKLITNLRKSIYAHMVLPSTHHALCRLFLYSNQISSLISVLDDRVKYGVFPDFFSTNLILDEALERKNYALAAKTASLVMLQEEFGMNNITDSLSLYSIAKYVESRPSFDEWSKIRCEIEDTQIDGKVDENVEGAQSEEKNDDEKQDEVDEDEDEDEYIRVPFLRNPYEDNHFDLKDPRLICGKTFVALGRALETKHPNIAEVSSSIGRTLLDTAQEDLKEIYSRCEHLGKLVETQCSDLKTEQERDIDELRQSFLRWSKLRQATIERKQLYLRRTKLKEEIEAKKKELRLREQYLYFYDNNKL